MSSDGMSDTKRLELIAEAVQYCQRVKEMGMPASAYTKALREPIHFLWERRRGSKLQSAKFRSKAAAGLTFQNGQLVYDHAVPFRYIQDELLSLHQPSNDKIEEVLNRFETIVLITKDEDTQLNAAGYNHKMPPGWKVGEDPLARYKAVGIEIVSNDLYNSLNLEQIVKLSITHDCNPNGLPDGAAIPAC